ncbi:MAG: sulfite exporter TauE/SafE family protein [Pseudomonadota bacterium]
MIPVEIILMLVAAGFVAGGINALAGGSTLLTFPVLMAAGLPPTVANASNFVSALLGNAAAIPAYYKEIADNKTVAFRLTLASLAGATIGCLLLINSTDDVFLEIVPWLILTATLFYAFGGQISGLIRSRNGGGAMVADIPGYVLTFLFSIYGGYFGAGLGVITLAVLKMIGYSDFHEANALKNLTNTMIGILGIIIFSLNGLIAWTEAIVMMVGAGLGGYTSIRYARRISQRLLTNAVIILGLCLSVYYFLK